MPKLESADRRESFNRIYEMEENDLLTGGATDEEIALLNRELEESRQNPETGSSWNEVEARRHPAIERHIAGVRAMPCAGGFVQA